MAGSTESPGLQKLQGASRAPRHVSQPPPAVLSCPRGWQRDEQGQRSKQHRVARRALPQSSTAAAAGKRSRTQSMEEVGKPSTHLPGGCTQVGASSACFQAQGSIWWHTSCCGSTGALCSPISISCTISFWFRVVPQLVHAQGEEPV